MAGRQDTQRNAKSDHEETGDKHQFEGCRQKLGNIGRDRTIGIERDTQIPAGEIADKIGVLDND